MLVCRACNGGFPLSISPEEVDTSEVAFCPEFVQRMLSRLSYPEFIAAAAQFGVQLPEAITEEDLANEELVRALHHALKEIEVVKGTLTCPQCSRVFPIVNGIPDMLLTPEECA